jgi:hypothetical protein
LPEGCEPCTDIPLISPWIAKTKRPVYAYFSEPAQLQPALPRVLIISSTKRLPNGFSPGTRFYDPLSIRLLT